MKPTVTYNLDKLHNFVKGLSAKKYAVDVGILGDKNARTEKGNTNTAIGAVHEFGNSKIPRRSFLRMPMHQQSNQILRYVGTKALKLMALGKFQELLKQLGLACEKAIQEAFVTHGFGAWPALKQPTIKRKGHNEQLIETRQMQRSITSRVRER